MVNNQNVIKEVTKYIEVPVSANVVIHKTTARLRMMNIPSGYSHCIYLYSDSRGDVLHSQYIVAGYCITYNIADSNCFYVYTLNNYCYADYNNHIYIDKDGNYIINNASNLNFLESPYTCFLW